MEYIEWNASEPWKYKAHRDCKAIEFWTPTRHTQTL